MNDELERERWREQAEHWHEEAKRLRAALEAKQQVANSPTSLTDNAELIEDMARWSEGLYSKTEVKTRWRKIIDDQMWETLGSNDELVEKIELRKVHRIRNGQAKREKAQSLVVRAPEILDSIASDKSASPRHRVDAIKTLDGMSDTGPQATPAADRFIIQINLGEDYKLRFDKSIAPVAHDRDVEIIDDTLQITDGSDR